MITKLLTSRSFARLATCLACCMIQCWQSHAFVPVLNERNQPLRWELQSPSTFVHTNVVNPKTKAIRFYLERNAYSLTNTLSELNAIRASFQQWSSIPGSHLRFEEGGLVGPGADINTVDNTNVVFWVKNGTLINGGRDDLRGALGLSYQDFFDDNTIAEADIVLNGNVAWFTDHRSPNPDARYVESVVLHEIGHFIGLNHSPVGASTMMVRGVGGIGTQAGLSTDEIAAAKWLYPQPISAFATVKGTVKVGGKVVLGAVVSLEDSDGNMTQSTVTGIDGVFTVPSVKPGSYQLRVSPLDPRSNRSTMLTGSDIDPFGTFQNAETSFLPTANRSINLLDNEVRTENFELSPDTSAFRITRIRPPQDSPNTFFSLNTSVAISPGRSNVFVGVYGPNLPTSGATLKISGRDVFHGEVTYLAEAFTGINLVSVKLSVSSDAVPGMRSFILESQGKVAYANGFIEITQSPEDLNFDGLADQFQRDHFSPWTGAEAGPTADPDGDGFDNLKEYVGNSNPKDSKSIPTSLIPFRILHGSSTSQGFVIRWQAAPNVKYRILSRDLLDLGLWQELGVVVSIGADPAQFIDSAPSAASRYYWVESFR